MELTGNSPVSGDPQSGLEETNVLFHGNLAQAGLNSALSWLLYNPFVSMLRMLHFVEPKTAPTTGSRRVSLFSILVAAFLLVTCIAFLMVH